MEIQTPEVRIDEQSTAADLRDQTRERAKASLEFFLESVLSVRLTPELSEALARLQQRKLLLEVAEGTALWYKIRGAKLKVRPIDHDVVTWLFPEVKEL